MKYKEILETAKANYHDLVSGESLEAAVEIAMGLNLIAMAIIEHSRIMSNKLADMTEVI